MMTQMWWGRGGGDSAIHIKTCRQDVDCGGPLHNNFLILPKSNMSRIEPPLPAMIKLSWYVHFGVVLCVCQYRAIMRQSV